MLSLTFAWLKQRERRDCALTWNDLYLLWGNTISAVWSGFSGKLTSNPHINNILGTWELGEKKKPKTENMFSSVVSVLRFRTEKRGYTPDVLKVLPPVLARRVTLLLMLLHFSVSTFPPQRLHLSIWICMILNVLEHHITPLDQNWNDIHKINVSPAMLLYSKMITKSLQLFLTLRAVEKLIMVAEAPLEDPLKEIRERERREISWNGLSLQSQ